MIGERLTVGFAQRKRQSARHPIRITYVIPTLDQSGAERQLYLLASHLPPDIEPEVVALSRGGFYAEQLQAAGIPVTVLGKRFRFDPLTFVRLRSHLRRARPDLVQSCLFAANAYVRLPGVTPAATRVVVAERCVDSWKSGWQLAMDRRLRQRMARMTANSAAVAEFYQQTVGIPPEQIEVIPNGLPLPPTSGSVEPSAPPVVDLRESLGLPQNARLVGFVGRLAVQKRLSDLIWAFHLLQSVMDDVYLVIVGEGDQRQPLAELATRFGCRAKIFFTGHNPDATSLVSQLNAFCLPSEFEGMSNSLMEALAAGVPTVVSDIPANRELVEHEQTGFVFPLGDGPAMARTLKKLLEDRPLAERVAAQGRSLMAERHSLQQLVDRHVALYRQLTAI